ncbi:hypothetical protein HMPREF1550_01686 [Actinomyces sp. oral taxon 877 str. F0543]|nr:hypothetical protein HMPREF1550_01686 [Actinomyces sp. oral taxon 877 str. F0543]
MLRSRWAAVSPLTGVVPLMLRVYNQARSARGAGPSGERTSSARGCPGPPRTRMDSRTGNIIGRSVAWPGVCSAVGSPHPVSSVAWTLMDSAP